MIPQRAKIHGRRRRANRQDIRTVAETIFEQAEKFAGYGFNKGRCRGLCPGRLSNRLSEGELSESNSWPRSMTLDIGNTDRLNIFRQEAQRLGVTVAPPDINRSAKRCSPAMRRPTQSSMRWRR